MGRNQIILLKLFLNYFIDFTGTRMLKPVISLSFVLHSLALSAQIQADFIADNVSGCEPLIVNYENLSTGSSTLTYFWDFGNGNTSTITNPSASYLSLIHI